MKTRSTMLVAAALILAGTLARAQSLPKPLSDYHLAQSLAFSNCSTQFTVASLDADTARMTHTTGPNPYAVVWTCIRAAEDDIKAQYKAIAASLPTDGDREAMTNIQVAFVTAIRAVPPEPGERPSFSAAHLRGLRDKLDEAWNRYEATH